MYKNRWRYKKAFDYVKKIRNFIDPNIGFKKQLQLLEIFFIDQQFNLEKLKGKTQAELNKIYG